MQLQTVHILFKQFEMFNTKKKKKKKSTFESILANLPLWAQDFRLWEYKLCQNYGTK